MSDLHTSRILILDFGSQYTQLIARRLREIGIYCEIKPYDISNDAVRAFGARGIVLSGGPESATLAVGVTAPDAVFTCGVPVLGICYGMQIMAVQLGGTVIPALVREFGFVHLEKLASSRLLDGLQCWSNEAGQHSLDVWMSHCDQISHLPPGFSVIGATDNAEVAAMADDSRGFYGLQFHPEVTHTPQGQAIIKRFALTICGCEPLWTSTAIIADSIARVRAQVGNDGVLLALSGGVDSSVVAALLRRAVGDKLHCVLVDNGLMRLNEADEVVATFSALDLTVHKIDAQERFLRALKGIVDPEEKRRIIGKLFIEIFEEHAARIRGIKWLAQGTIYPDVIESAGTGDGKARVIKTHHNVGGLPERMQLGLVEPLRELFKDEVRHIGVELGLPHELVYRHPFPGPGLGVRVLGKVKRSYLDMLRAADDIFIKELRAADLYSQVSQAFAVFLPVKSVGVKGDARHYEYVIALRAVETVDFMTAGVARLPHDFLYMVASRIINEVAGISRVTYDISSKPPATIEWE